MKYNLYVRYALISNGRRIEDNIQHEVRQTCREYSSILEINARHSAWGINDKIGTIVDSFAKSFEIVDPSGKHVILEKMNNCSTPIYTELGIGDSTKTKKQINIYRKVIKNIRCSIYINLMGKLRTEF